MNIIICIDNNNGMLFNNRRQSQDKVLRQKIFEIAGNNKLYMNNYSYKQFSDIENIKIHIDEDYLEKAEKNDFCFVENQSVQPFINQCNKIYVFKWNRNYPYDVKLDIDLSDFRLIYAEDFKGSSHEKITLEVYLNED